MKAFQAFKTFKQSLTFNSVTNSVAYLSAGALTALSAYIYYHNPSSALKHSFTRGISRLAGKIANKNIPTPIRSPFFNWYVNKYEVNLTESTEPLVSFHTL